ncbi:MAG: VCBS domain-containing protein, partial [Pseudomonas sp.]
MATSTGITVSFGNTPQAGDDCFSAGLTEDSTGAVLLDVMANDLGGKAKILWSLDDGSENEGSATSADLLTRDVVGADNFSKFGALIEITADGKVAYSMTDASRDYFQSLGAGEVGYDTFTYAIRLANGTLSWATATVQINGTNDVATFTSASDHAVTEAGGVGNAIPGDPHASGVVTVHDVDAGQAVFAAPTLASLAGTYGDFTF